VVLGVIRNLLLLLRWWGTLNLLDVGRLMLRRTLGVWVLGRWVVALCRTLRRYRLVGRVGMVLVLLMDYTRPRMVDWKMIWRWQALRRMGMMHVGRDAPELG
jgi:hypothetical protein